MNYTDMSSCLNNWWFSSIEWKSKDKFTGYSSWKQLVFLAVINRHAIKKEIVSSQTLEHLGWKKTFCQVLWCKKWLFKNAHLGVWKSDVRLSMDKNALVLSSFSYFWVSKAGFWTLKAPLLSCHSYAFAS